MAFGAVATRRGATSGPLVIVQGVGSSPPRRRPELVSKSRRSVGSYWILKDRFLDGVAGENCTPITVRNYEQWLRRFGDWLEGRNHSCEVEQIGRADVLAYFASHLQAGRKPATVRCYHAVLKRYFGFVANEPEVGDDWRNPMEGVRPPRVPIEPPAVLRREEIAALLKACEGKRFEDLRDMAMVRVLLSTGIRRGELAGLTVEDANAAIALSNSRSLGRLSVTGKTGPREVFLSHLTRQALSRYLSPRVRGAHPQRHAKVRDARGHVRGEALWIGKHGTLTGDGIRRILKARATAAGIEQWWTHLMRHTSVHEHLVEGMHEHHLATLMGWRGTAMLERYAARQAVDRAMDEASQLAIGDLI